MPLGAVEKWKGQPPKVADKPEIWQKLVPELMSKGMYFGALASAQTMLNFFSDLPSKELAYKTIVEVIDKGYPFSTRTSFVPGDLDISGLDNFSQSYMVYKGIVNIDKKMQKWADYYFTKVDKENFPKYLFYQATLAYQNKKIPEAIQLLKQTLSKSTALEHTVLAHKAARTLARIYYEMKEYEKSRDIYQNFLLKLNPVTPTDWIETAWVLFQLKRYPESLGLMYNFEAKNYGSTLQIEKYILRALIYREYCSTEATIAMIESFEREFGEVIEGIKLGEPLSKFSLLVKIGHAETQTYRKYSQTLLELQGESNLVGQLSSESQSVAKYIYESEIKLTKSRLRQENDRARDTLARYLVILGESLRFVKFDVYRSKYNPDRVFLETPEYKNLVLESSDDDTFKLRWFQWGDYWRDERNSFSGVLEDKCEK